VRASTSAAGAGRRSRAAAAGVSTDRALFAVRQVSKSCCRPRRGRRAGQNHVVSNKCYRTLRPTASKFLTSVEVLGTPRLQAARESTCLRLWLADAERFIRGRDGAGDCRSIWTGCEFEMACVASASSCDRQRHVVVGKKNAGPRRMASSVVGQSREIICPILRYDLPRA